MIVSSEYPVSDRPSKTTCVQHVMRTTAWTVADISLKRELGKYGACTSANAKTVSQRKVLTCANSGSWPNMLGVVVPRGKGAKVPRGTGAALLFFTQAENVLCPRLRRGVTKAS
eukprot:9482278-Pyramimonas_sp.AAC.2